MSIIFLCKQYFTVQKMWYLTMLLLKNRCETTGYFLQKNKYVNRDRIFTKQIKNDTDFFNIVSLFIDILDVSNEVFFSWFDRNFTSFFTITEDNGTHYSVFIG